MFWRCFSRSRVRTRPHSQPADTRHTCSELDAMPLPFSPLVSEMLAMHAHTRQIAWLAEREYCPDEFRLAARSVLGQLLQAWDHQSGGHGTIDDLLVDPRTPSSTGYTARPTATGSTVMPRDIPSPALPGTRCR
ncbi:hypothetical protein [Streptomyces scopuliridis]|uniref:hypothetical protein n=1 Tax=Streptomyces scopuliridis TaxID=452529 RepID=UPI00367FEC73